MRKIVFLLFSLFVLVFSVSALNYDEPSITYGYSTRLDNPGKLSGYTYAQTNNGTMQLTYHQSLAGPGYYFITLGSLNSNFDIDGMELVNEYDVSNYYYKTFKKYVSNLSPKINYTVHSTSTIQIGNCYSVPERYLYYKTFEAEDVKFFRRRAFHDGSVLIDELSLPSYWNLDGGTVSDSIPYSTENGNYYYLVFKVNVTQALSSEGFVLIDFYSSCPYEIVCQQPYRVIDNHLIIDLTEWHVEGYSREFTVRINYYPVPSVVNGGNVDYLSYNFLMGLSESATFFELAHEPSTGALFYNLFDYLSSYFSNLNSNLTSLFDSLGLNIDGHFSDLSTQLEYNRDNLALWIASTRNTLHADLDTLHIDLTDINSTIELFRTGFSQLFQQWMVNIQGKLNNIIQLLSPSDPGSEDLIDKSEVDSQIIQDDIDIIESVTKPDLDTLNLNITYSDSSMELLSGFFTKILSNSFFLQLFLYLFTFILVSYVLYGKKG